MGSSPTTDRAGLSGVGRWFAVASELPCMVIVFLFIGQLLGSSWAGPQGATYGALIGALLGFFIGVISVYKTIEYLDVIEAKTRAKKPYMPPMEEILEDVEFDLEDDE
ncbi:MAG: hypothetical protein ACW992_11055 [Candidatus Thorarchaeota archaeon]|jgi:Na+-driven multidrug efflux pump